MANILFILGAGASREGGGPLMFDFLDEAEDVRGEHNLAPEEEAAFDTVFSGLRKLRSAHSKAQLDTNNIETVFAAFEMASLLGIDLGSDLPPEKLRGAMRSLIAATIEFRVRPSVMAAPPRVLAPAAYGDFGRLVNKLLASHHEVGIATFNYDCGVELGLLNASLSYDYGLSGEVPRGGMGVNRTIPLLKLHGSLNWGRMPSGEVRVLSLSDFVDRGLLGAGPGPVAFRLSRSVLNEFRGSEIAIVPPVWNKTDEHRSLNSVWKHAARLLAHAQVMVVSGYSLPDTDYFFRHLYALGSVGESRVRGFFVADPAPEVEERFRSLLGPEVAAPGRFRFDPWTFQDAVNSQWITHGGPLQPFVSGR